MRTIFFLLVTIFALMESLPAWATELSCATAQRTLTIMPLGDSITEAKEGYASYRYFLFQRLKAKGCSINFVGSRRGVSKGHRDSAFGNPKYKNFDTDHEGHWDYRSDEIRKRIATWYGRMPADIVIIHVGSNDIFRGKSIQQAVENIVQSIKIIKKIRPDVRILVSKIISSNRKPDQIASFNRLLERRIQESTKLSLVDLHTGFKSSLHTYDGVHPNELGERLMAERLARVL